MDEPPHTMADTLPMTSNQGWTRLMRLAATARHGTEHRLPHRTLLRRRRISLPMTSNRLCFCLMKFLYR
jgi:hypothetical protein